MVISLSDMSSSQGKWLLKKMCAIGSYLALNKHINIGHGLKDFVSKPYEMLGVLIKNLNFRRQIQNIYLFFKIWLIRDLQKLIDSHF